VFSPLLTSVIERAHLVVVDTPELDRLSRKEVFSMIYFPGDAERLVESDDVSVILPELAEVFKGAVRTFVVSRDSERLLQHRYHFNRFPCLVFLRNGAYLGIIQGVRNWTDYLNEIPEILLREPSDPPPYKFFPEGCGTLNDLSSN
jgi:hydrogenase-1 operon protein HyaE